MEAKHNDKITLMGVDFSGTEKEGLLKEVEKAISSELGLFISTPNPEILLLAKSNENLKAVLNSSDIAIPDGFGLQIASKVFYLPRFYRIPGRIFMLDLFTLANKKRLKVFLLGSTKEVSDKSVEKIKREYPNINIQGLSGPRLKVEGVPINKENEKINKETISTINKFKPDLLFIAFGAPKQELWWGENKEKLNVKVSMVVGGSLDYFSGAKKTPPKFVSDMGLEWVWRLIFERGHFKRVFNAVVVFPIVVLNERLKLFK